MFCSKCGAQVPEGSAFCTVCGNKLEPVNQQINEQGAQPSYEGPAAPQQPAYEPVQPQQPMYEQPAQPSYEGPAAPQQPVYEPAQPQYQQAPPQYPQGGAPQPLPPKKSNKGLIIGIIAAVVVVVIVVAVLFGTGAIGGKDSGDSEDNKTTYSQKESEKNRDDSSKLPEQTVVADDKITLSNGLSFGVGDKVEVFDKQKGLNIKILDNDDNTISSLDDTIAAGEKCYIDFDTNGRAIIVNDSSSDIKIRDAEIGAVYFLDSYNSTGFMGLKPDATEDEILAKLNELNYTKKGTLDEDNQVELMDNFLAMSEKEYYIVSVSDGFFCVAKTEDGNYINFRIVNNNNSKQFQYTASFREEFLSLIFSM